MASLQEAIVEAKKKHAEGDARGAFQELRSLLEFPAARLAEKVDFVAAFATFAAVAKSIAGAEFGAHIAAASTSPDDADVLYNTGYALYEQGLFAIAATVLTRARAQAPGSVRIVEELAGCFEKMLAYAHAALMLDTSGLADGNDTLAYLSGFNWIMSGEVPRAARRLEQLTNGQSEQTERTVFFEKRSRAWCGAPKRSRRQESPWETMRSRRGTA